MNILLKLAFLFFIGSLSGWGIEVLYRRFFSGANPERKWINPGFCVGPYVPLYGFGLCILFVLAGIALAVVMGAMGWRKWMTSAQVWLIALLAALPTLLYYLLGPETSANFFSFFINVALIFFLEFGDAIIFF